jgi:hypothetical protein
MRIPRCLPSLAATTALVLGTGRPAASQVRTHAIELTLSAGAFVPTGNEGPNGSSDLGRGKAALGAAHLGFNAPKGRITAEIEAGYAAERIRETNGGSAYNQRTNLFYGAARLLVGRNPRLPGVSYLIGAGPSFILRRKSVLDPETSQSNLGGSAIASFRIPIDGQVGARFDAQDLIYRADFGLGQKLRNDFAITIGLSIAY